MEAKTITLAGKDYELSRLTYSRSRQWRQEHGAIVKRLLGATRQISPLLADGKNLMELNLADLGRVLLNHAGDLVELFVDGSDLALDAICSYAPEIAADRARIETEAYDEELLGAFWEVVQLAFPLAGSVRRLVTIGQGAGATSKSSPLPNGEEPLTSSTPKT